MRIGLFGGTFDPVHQGHLILAERCRDDAQLDEVWLMPNYVPPHKGQEITRFEHRVDMLNLAITGQPKFKVDPIEKELPPPSYTAETLAELKRRHPEHVFALIMGADCLPDLHKWYEPLRVVAEAELLVVPRPGYELWSAQAVADSLKTSSADIRLSVIECPLIDIASREVRQRVQAGKSVRYIVPRAVEEFIRERGLYVS
jgi:nicotinate-nucleotide adenylyltransferase